MEDAGVRLNKYLGRAGVSSRREADRLIAAGEVYIDGERAQIGQRVFPGQQVVCQGRPVKEDVQPVILLVNKPAGIVCTAERRERNNIVAFIDYPQRIYPVGRLDKASRGLILMTNQGDIVNRLLRAANFHEKEYVVRVDRPITPAFLKQMAAGVFLPELEQTTRKCRVYQIDARTFGIVLTQGLNRQIRRMCAALGYRVEDLLRIRIMNLTLGDLSEGAYREITREELQELTEALALSRRQD